MVATLPPKPWLNKPGVTAYQQKIATYQTYSTVGVRYAEAQARQLGERIAVWRAARKNPSFFDWSLYQSNVRASTPSVAEVVSRFEKQYRETHSLKDSSWRKGWGEVFRRLPQDKPIDEEMLLQEVLSRQRDTKSRLNACCKLQALANFAEIDVDLLQYKGNYSASKVKPRRLPSDIEIAEWYYRIPNPSWQWIYGILAAGGLRPHEAFFCKWEGKDEEDRHQKKSLAVCKGKTNERTVLQFFYPEWIDEWDLLKIRLPNIDAESAYEKQRLGERVSKQFKRYGVPFCPYDLRHRAAVRMSVDFELPITVAADLMGHSVKEHTRTYHKHITKAAKQRAIDRSLQASDRPQPPKIKKEE